MPRSKLHPKVICELFCNFEDLFLWKQIYRTYSGFRVTHKAFYCRDFLSSRLCKTWTLFFFLVFGEFLTMWGLAVGNAGSQVSVEAKFIPPLSLLTAEVLENPLAQCLEFYLGLESGSSETKAERVVTIHLRWSNVKHGRQRSLPPKVVWCPVSRASGTTLISAPSPRQVSHLQSILRNF